jgi:hypothetical protein
MIITREKLEELRKSVHRNFEMISDIAKPPNCYRMGDFLDTIDALWRGNEMAVKFIEHFVDGKLHDGLEMRGQASKTLAALEEPKP